MFVNFDEMNCSELKAWASKNLEIQGLDKLENSEENWDKLVHLIWSVWDGGEEA